MQYMGMKTPIQFYGHEELLDIRYDHIFKAVFTRDTPASKGALSDLISTFIERWVTVSTITTNEPPIEDIRDRNIRYDISCKTEKGELVNIEITVHPALYEPVRLEYYAGKLFTRQDIRGVERNYSNLKEAYQIALFANGQFFNDQELVHRFEYYDAIHNISLGGKSRIIIVELKKAELVIEKPIAEMSAHEAWAVFFQYLTNPGKRGKINEIMQREAGIAMASEELIHITQEDREWAYQLSREKYILDTQSMKADARREGREEGREKGRKEGLEEGIKKGLLEVAKNLKEKGVSIAIIAESTGMSMEEVANL